jgi:hypothetical protein
MTGDRKPPREPPHNNNHTAEIVRFPGITTLDLDPDLILREAVGKLEGCVIAGFDKAGRQYFASSYADGAEVVYHLERAKWLLMRRLDELAEEGADPRGPSPAA